MTDPLIPLIEYALTQLDISAATALLYLARFFGITTVLGPLLARFVPWARERAAETKTKVDDNAVLYGLVPFAEFIAWCNVIMPRITTGISDKEARPRVRPSATTMSIVLMLVAVAGLATTFHGCARGEPRTPADHVQIQFVAVGVALDAADISVNQFASRRVNVCLDEMREQRATDTDGYDRCVRDVTTAAIALASVRAALVMADRTLAKIQEGTFDLDPCGLVDNVLVELNNAIASLRALGPEMVEHVTSLTTLLPTIGHRVCDVAHELGDQP